MDIEVDNIEQFEDFLAKYLFGELNSSEKKALLNFVIKNEQARSLYLSTTKTNSILSYALSQTEESSDPIVSKKNETAKIFNFTNRWSRSSQIVAGLTAAMIFLASGISFWLGYRSDLETKLDQVFIHSYGDCKIDGVTSQPGTTLLNRKLISGSFSICEFQLVGNKSVAARMLPKSEVFVTGDKKHSALNVIHGSVIIDSKKNEFSDPESFFSILSPDVKALLAGTKVFYSRITKESDSELDLEVLEGKVEMETGPFVVFEKTANSLNEEEREFLKANFPILFQSKKIELNFGQSLSWKGISESGLDKIRAFERNIEDAKSKGIGLKESFAANPDLKKINQEKIFQIDERLDQKIKKLSPNETNDLEMKFKSMVRFPPSDLKEIEKLNP